MKRLLLESDAPEQFAPPAFDSAAAHRRALVLAKRLEEVTGGTARIADPSLSQDGALFTTIALTDSATKRTLAHAHLSSFANFATVERCTGQVLQAIVHELRSLGYVHIPIEFLEAEYDGRFDAFKGSSWQYRYFAPVHTLTHRFPSPVRVRWLSDLQFEAGRASQEPIRIDGNARTAPGPFDVLASALAAAVSTDVANALCAQGTPVESLEVRVVTARAAEPPHRLLSADLNFTIRAPGAVLLQVERALDESVRRAGSSMLDISVAWFVDLLS